ncbi:hypothetical protein T265_07753 [Opisthorchis viverrini]|uniref:Galactose-1-phosphate uridylyltransferase n=1 Tax=Opisthorchis viverrini TaxID=6198 RepID=A0A074ZMM0_OPIVI|nr:hypothetical protein T265_07753 [Opisthorchis viverrini]KER24605.1 hypothetical protein T265_07753 [Opisthorchis viverrini]
MRLMVFYCVAHGARMLLDDLITIPCFSELMIPSDAILEVPNFVHRRYDPLMGEWIIVSPHRISRPWSGQLEFPERTLSNKPEPKSVVINPLCPGATRSSGTINPNYSDTFLFPNDFPALDTTDESIEDDHLASKALSENPLFAWAPAHGDCQVMCFHPDSNKTLALMSPAEVRRVIDAWCDLTTKYQSQRRYRWLQIFENRGAAVGCSNMHPHCQVWACGFLPSIVKRRDYNQRAYFETHGSPLLLNYARQEERTFGQTLNRLVIASEDWLVLVPWWACWPFETILLPRKRHIRWLHELTDKEREGLVEIIQQLLTRYDNLFHTDFPYSMGWYQAPFCNVSETSTSDITDYPYWQLHAIYQPPLLRSATVRKFMSGFELLCEPQRDLLPEKAAELLRKTSAVHYTRCQAGSP